MGADQHGEAYPEPPYRCPICRGNENRYLECEHPGCLDGRDLRHPHAKARTRYAAFCDAYPTQSEIIRRHKRSTWPGYLILAILLVIVLCGFKGYDPDQKTVQWFENLMQPYSQGSCCGKGDGYPVSDYWAISDGTGDFIAVIADGSAKKYPDGTERPYIATGTEVRVPGERVNPEHDDLNNPTDVSWIFMSVYTGNPGIVYCFIRHPQGN